MLLPQAFLLILIGSTQSQKVEQRVDILPDVLSLLRAEVTASENDSFESERNITFENGVLYSGQWENNQPNGQGRLEVPPRDVYV